MRIAGSVLIVVLLVAALAYAFMSAGDRESRKLPGPEWTGQGMEGISQAEAASFGRFDVYWLGPSFAGFNLQAILSLDDEIMFVYGSCTIPRGSDGGCSAPLSVQVQPACKITPATATQVAFSGPADTLRGGGVILRRYIPEQGEATAMAWTGDAVVRISLPAAPERFEEALRELRGLNRDAIGPGEALPAPDFAACD